MKQFVGLQTGIVGKPNTGKSTFFSALTMASAKIAPYPFTTIDSNRGVGYVRVECVCRELGVKDNPRNSKCIDGIRFVPVEVIDVAGLVPGAWEGRGLGNRFLDELRRADALIHVIDASGSTDSEGKPVKPGSHDPMEDVDFVEVELVKWIVSRVSRDWDRQVKAFEHSRSTDVAQFLAGRLSGFSFSYRHVARALEEAGLERKKLREWGSDDLELFVKRLIAEGKPILIAANKADLDPAYDNIRRLKRELEGRYVVVPTSAEAELALKRASEKGLIRYLPGDGDFEVVGNPTRKQARALEYIREKVLKRYGSTGVQRALETVYFDLLNMIAVFPVEDVNTYSDHYGNVLPDVYLLPRGSTARDLAYMIHTELGESFIYAVDARRKRRLGEDYVLRHRDVIKIVAAKRR